MVYKATQDVVRRVMPLLDLLATRTVDKARILQYLSARSGVDWGVLELLQDDMLELAGEESDPGERLLIVRDRASGAEHRVRYPAALPADIGDLVVAEYKRRAADNPLTLMAEPMFAHFFEESHCSRCRWRGEAFAQFHQECRFAARPVNFETEPGQDENTGDEADA